MLKIFSKDLKESLQQASQYIDQLEERLNSLEEENRSLKEEAKKCADKELLEDNVYLTDRLKRSYGEFSSEKELNAYKSFCKAHAKCRNSHASSGKFPYVIPTNCGVGISVRVVCPICGQWKDITDVSAW